MERDELKKLCGFNNSARIYSQLQRDYAKVCYYNPPPQFYDEIYNTIWLSTSVFITSVNAVIIQIQLLHTVTLLRM